MLVRYRVLSIILKGFVMIKKLSKYGNSWALLIDKPILDLLKINETTNLQIRTDGTCLIIEPVNIQHREKSLISSEEKLQNLYEELVIKYGSALKKLSKN